MRRNCVYSKDYNILTRPIINMYRPYNCYGYFEFVVENGEKARLRAICKSYGIKINLDTLNDGLEHRNWYLNGYDVRVYEPNTREDFLIDLNSQNNDENDLNDLEDYLARQCIYRTKNLHHKSEFKDFFS